MRKDDNREKFCWEGKRKERRWLRGWPEQSAEATNKSSTAHPLPAIPVYQFALRLSFHHVLISEVDSKLTVVKSISTLVTRRRSPSPKPAIVAFLHSSEIILYGLLTPINR